MDVETAVETTIEPQLVDALGRQVANSLLTRATLSYVTIRGDEKKRFEAFVNEICSDDRLINLWGEPAAAKQQEEWIALFRLE